MVGGAAALETTWIEQIEEVDLGGVLEDVFLLMRHELELDKIKILQDIPKDLPPVKVDRRHFEEILFNLMMNACQAIKAQEIEGEIAISAVQQNGHVNILIRDNGPGIPSDKINQIFEPFYTTKDDGTGLGLYVTKQLVEKSNGKISVKSKFPSGVEFSLRFPRKEWE